MTALELREMERKAGILIRLKVLLKATDRNTVENIQLEDNGMVKITFFGGGTRMVNIECDSDIAMLRDVLAAIH